MQKCPFCKIELDDEAVICNGCGAKYGYNFGHGTIFESRLPKLIKTETIASFFLFGPFLLGGLALIFTGTSFLWGLGLLLVTGLLWHLALNRYKKAKPAWWR